MGIERGYNSPRRKCGRVVDCTGLENRRLERVREFESHRFRQNPLFQAGFKTVKTPTTSLSLKAKNNCQIVALVFRRAIHCAIPNQSPEPSLPQKYEAHLGDANFAVRFEQRVLLRPIA